MVLWVCGLFVHIYLVVAIQGSVAVHLSCYLVLIFLVSWSAALNYGLFRQSSFNTTSHYVMFYDMGAVSTTATIVGKGWLC